MKSLVKPLAFLTVGLCFAVWTVPLSALAAGKIKVKACTVAPEGTPWEQITKKAKKSIRKASSGVVKLKVYFGGAKGGEPECLAKVYRNELQMYGGTLSAMNKYAPDLEVFDLPFLFNSSEEADYVLDNHATPMVSKILHSAELVLYMWAENGWHNIGSKGKFVKTPADLAGLKIRAQPSPVHALTWNEMGANPVQLDAPDVSTALTKGTITAFGQTPLYTFAANWQPFVTHYSLTRHLYQPGVIVWSKKFYDSQSPDVQKFLLTDAQKLAEEGRAGVRKLEPNLIENFRSYGIKVYDLTASERKAFAKKSKEVISTYRKGATPAAKQLLDVIAKGKKAFK